MSRGASSAEASSQRRVAVTWASSRASRRFRTRTTSRPVSDSSVGSSAASTRSAEPSAASSLRAVARPMPGVMASRSQAASSSWDSMDAPTAGAQRVGAIMVSGDDDRPGGTEPVAAMAQGCVTRSPGSVGTVVSSTRP